MLRALMLLVYMRRLLAMGCWRTTCGAPNPDKPPWRKWMKHRHHVAKAPHDIIHESQYCRARRNSSIPSRDAEAVTCSCHFWQRNQAVVMSARRACCAAAERYRPKMAARCRRHSGGVPLSAAPKYRQTLPVQKVFRLTT